MKRFFVLVLAALVLLFSTGPVVMAQENLEEQDLELIRLREEIKKEMGFNWRQIGAISRELRDFLVYSAERDEARSMVRTSVENGCRGACLTETLRAMNIAMEGGVGASEARGMVSEALGEHKALKGKALGAQVVQSVEQKLGSR